MKVTRFAVLVGLAGLALAPCGAEAQESRTYMSCGSEHEEPCPLGDYPQGLKRCDRGLFNDGGVDIYFSGKVPMGSHELEIKMDDSIREEGFNHAFRQQIDIDPSRIVLIDFDSETGFVVR